jgi:large subunit ribosomal protein L17
MRHRLAGRKFNRDSGHRKLLMQGLAKSLIQYEQIKTTLPKAKDLRPFVEKIITAGKVSSLARRRHLLRILGDKVLANKVLTVLADRYKDRPGGYTRILKAGFRYGDAAPMAIIEFVDRDPAAKPIKKLKESDGVEAASGN